MQKNFLHFLFFFFFFITVSSSPTLPDRFQKPSVASLSLRRRKPQEYFEIAQPLSLDHPQKPSCTLRVLNHCFGNTVGSPPISVPYSPPSNCPTPWSRVVLDLRASCRGEQYDRIAAVWLGGAEILRTSTAEPTNSGIFWKVRKDVTRYSSLLARSDLSLSMMLENIVNDVFTGVYRVELSLLYYNHDGVRVPPAVADPTLNRRLGELDDEIRLESEKLPVGIVSSFDSPADLVIPISSDGGEGFWFRIESESDVHTTKIQIPPNTRRAVVEMYVSFHGDDEFWYSNPPDSYIELNHINSRRGNGAFREVYVTIDGGFVASEIAFPVIFTGGINPLFWEPLVAIGAFDLPSYDMELTPFLGLLLDGKPHEFGIGVADGIKFWLIDANLHLWLDKSLKKVAARSVISLTPTLSVKRKSKFKRLDGSFVIQGKRTTTASGWVISGAGNLTTSVSRSFRFTSSITFARNGTSKSAKHSIRSKTVVRSVSEKGELINRRYSKRKFPLHIVTRTLPGKEEGTDLIITNVSHALSEKLKAKGKLSGGFVRSLWNSQVCGGWMVVKDHSVLSGAAETNQSLTYREGIGCYQRAVAAVSGKIVDDKSTASCASSW